MRKSFFISIALAIIAGLIASCTTNPTAPKSNAKAITEFSIANPAATGIIDTAEKTIDIVVPEGTDVTALIANFTTTEASVTVGTTAQVSGTTQNDYTTPVLFTVKAEDNSTAQYTVTVTVATKSINAFSFTTPAVSGVIDETTKTISVIVPDGTALTALSANFITNGVSVSVNDTAQVSGTSTNDFSSPVVYNVKGLDNSVNPYTVSVLVATKAITAFSLVSPAVTGVIDETAKNIKLIVPEGTDTSTALVAQFSTNGANVSVGGTLQVSGTTANNYNIPLVFDVKAIDSTVAQYTVNLIIATKSITSFSFVSPELSGVINDSARTITITLIDSATDVKALIAKFTTNGIGVNVGLVTQVTDSTPNDFKTPVVYTVTGLDFTTKEYTVTVKNPFAKEITAFSFANILAYETSINESAKTISVSLRKGSDLTALAASFATTGSKVEIGAIEQISDTTTNDFSGPVVFKVTAANQSSNDYTVNVAATQSACLFISSVAEPGIPEESTLIQRVRTSGFIVHVESALNLPNIITNLPQFDFAFLSESPVSTAYAPLKGHPLPLLNLEAWACVKSLNYSTNKFVSNYDSLPLLISTKTDTSLLNGLTIGSEVKFINGYSSGEAEIGFIPTIANIPIAMFKDTSLVHKDSTGLLNVPIIDTLLVDSTLVDSATFAQYTANGGLTAACAVDSGVTLADGISITQNRAVTIGIHATSYGFISDEAFKLIDAGIRWILRKN